MLKDAGTRGVGDGERDSGGEWEMGTLSGAGDLPAGTIAVACSTLGRRWAALKLDPEVDSANSLDPDRSFNTGEKESVPCVLAVERDERSKGEEV